MIQRGPVSRQKYIAEMAGGRDGFGGHESGTGLMPMFLQLQKSRMI
jgi:hypothetical protein